MRLVRWTGVVYALGALASGCGGSSAGESYDGGGGVAPQPTSNVPTGPIGEVTRDNDAGASDPDVAYSVTLKMTPFTVPAGAEVYKCQDFASPFGGGQVDVKTFQAAMSQGSHHMTLFNEPGANNGPLIDCPQGGVMAGVYSFGAQSPNATFAAPKGIGAAMPAGMGFTMDSHYINVGTTPLEASVAVSMYVAVPGTVTQHAGALQALLLTISVPPTGQPVNVGSTCSLPHDMNALALAAHMHKRATHFIASTGGSTLLETNDWSETPPANFSPPLALKAGADLTWSCTYTNETNAPLTYGPSALTNVMCNAVLVYYPIQDINNPLLSCVQ